jgi:hypothetical protein
LRFIAGRKKTVKQKKTHFQSAGRRPFSGRR